MNYPDNGKHTYQVTITLTVEAEYAEQAGDLAREVLMQHWNKVWSTPASNARMTVERPGISPVLITV
jgi:hypothetical protein